MPRNAEIAREQQAVTRFYERLDALREQTRRRLQEVRRRGASGTHQARSERDAFATMYEDRVATLDAVEAGLCFGRLDLTTGELLHIGRLGLSDERHNTLLVDWRAPAAEPFYRATPADPHGVRRRRHLRTRARQVTDVEDDVFDIDDLTADDRDTLGGGGALLAALTEARTGRMRDIVATIQAEQDRVIRADPTGVLVVQGGPGTGKTAVALHRAAYLLYSHRDRLARSGVLVVGPGQAFLRYIEAVLPSLGETGVLLSTLPELVSGVSVEGADTEAVAALKADLRMAELIERAVVARQLVPDEPFVFGLDEHEIVLTPSDVANARSRARRTRRRHNRARYSFAMQLLRLAIGRLAEVDAELARERWVARELMNSEEFKSAVDACWPRLSAADLIRDLLTTDGLDAAGTALFSPAERRQLARPADAAWSAGDVPLLDEARAQLGDPDEMVRVAARRRKVRMDREFAQQVVEASGVAGRVDASRLAKRFADPGQHAGGTVAERSAADPEWEFGHVIVDEAQELSPMAWRMLSRRCPSRSMTVVGDIAQTSATSGASSWQQVLGPIAGERWTVRELTVNYRTPLEIMAVAADALHAVDPDASIPSSVRESGTAPAAHRVAGGDLAGSVAAVAASSLATLEDGTLAVLCAPGSYDAVVSACRDRFGDVVGTAAGGLESRVSVMSVTQAKGLEFDAVVVVEPAALLERGQPGLRDLYVALTRATQRLDVVHTGELPAVLAQLHAQQTPSASGRAD